jgi:hypothetical protein
LERVIGLRLGIGRRWRPDCRGGAVALIAEWDGGRHPAGGRAEGDVAGAKTGTARNEKHAQNQTMAVGFYGWHGASIGVESGSRKPRLPRLRRRVPSGP